MTKLIRTIIIFLAIFMLCMPVFVQATSVNMNLTSNTTADNTIANNTISDENDSDSQTNTISDSLSPMRNKSINRFSKNKFFKSITRSCTWAS